MENVPRKESKSAVAKTALQDFVAVVRPGTGQRVERDLRGCGTVDAVDGRIVAVVRGLVVGDPLLAGLGGLLVRADAAEGQVGAVAGIARALVPRLFEDAVTGHDLDVRHGRPEVLPELARVLAR